MSQVIGDILPLAMAVLISPVPIVAQILLLFTTSPRASATAYLVGFVVGVAAVLGLLVVLADATSVLSGRDASSGPSTVRIVLGALLAIGGFRRLRRARAEGAGEAAEKARPKWMDGIESFTPARSLGVGALVGAANPKNVVMALAAAVAISGGGLTGGQQAAVVAVYCLIAALGVAAPLVVAIAMGSRSQEVLDGWKVWLTGHNDVVMAVLFIVIGVVVLGKGLGTL